MGATLRGREIKVVLADPSKAGKYPTAYVEVDSQFVKGTVELMAIEDSSHDLVIGPVKEKQN